MFSELFSLISKRTTIRVWKSHVPVKVLVTWVAMMIRWLAVFARDSAPRTLDRIRHPLSGPRVGMKLCLAVRSSVVPSLLCDSYKKLQINFWSAGRHVVWLEVTWSLCCSQVSCARKSHVIRGNVYSSDTSNEFDLKHHCSHFHRVVCYHHLQFHKSGS